jgi:hypothetical protein
MECMDGLQAIAECRVSEVAVRDCLSRGECVDQHNTRSYFLARFIKVSERCSFQSGLSTHFRVIPAIVEGLHRDRDSS